MVFEPALVKIARATPSNSSPRIKAQRRNHQGMLPADAAPVAGKSGEDLAVTLDKLASTA